jgi:isopenicillin-N epimerase
MAADPGEIIEAAVAAMTERTRLFFFSHVLSPTGMVLPARELCQEARRRGILTLVDGAHAPAFVPLDLASLPCDFYAANCHKWLLAPTGSGFLYLGEGMADRLEPLQVSWGYAPDPAWLDEPDEFGSTPRIRQFEFEGTRDPCPWLTLPEAIDFQARLGFTAIAGRMRELARFTRARLNGLAGLRLATPEHPDLCGGMTAFHLPAGVNAAVLRQHLWEKHRVEVPIIEKPYGLLLRVSTHFYNTEIEVDRLARAIEEKGVAAEDLHAL